MDNLKSTRLFDELAKIPFSKSVYIGSYMAFNIYSDDDTGDWHTLACWNPNTGLNPYYIMGLPNYGRKINTSNFLGDNGIYLANDMLKSMGIPEFAPKIYASTHARTFADLVIIGIKKGKPLKFFEIQDFDDFMHSYKYKKVTYDLLRHARGLTNKEKKLVKQWIEKAKEYE